MTVHILKCTYNCSKQNTISWTHVLKTIWYKFFKTTFFQQMFNWNMTKCLDGIERGQVSWYLLTSHFVCFHERMFHYNSAQQGWKSHQRCKWIWCDHLFPLLRKKEEEEGSCRIVVSLMRSRWGPRLLFFLLLSWLSTMTLLYFNKINTCKYTKLTWKLFKCLRKAVFEQDILHNFYNFVTFFPTQMTITQSVLQVLRCSLLW